MQTLTFDLSDRTARPSVVWHGANWTHPGLCPCAFVENVTFEVTSETEARYGG